ncbi:hypothetical protein H6F88_21195 [Oculatella sp. FACHB-28]|uniref:hypothetical protein n=1 Tax=Cyanophyceae TaxID=3028117 RepID=UPI0016833D6A|nr:MULTISPECIES: hypothetical protein [Cyanophyceae]MBD1870737.1 hypothetical protein [Cyanobacteria bacterium FACHB-471]MBD1998663.1 hypothetical protein [Leptolyngbya sp. FACHB-541]MBD2058479.1 hypothetical protein [Oculatella sp. FACHB-28]
MQDKSDRYRVKTVPTLTGTKRIGSYLVDAGLLTAGQIEVALNDQKVTGMRFGEILAARGWVKQQTVDYLMEKIVVPERHSFKQRVGQSKSRTDGLSANQPSKAAGDEISLPPRLSVPGRQSSSTEGQSSVRKDLPISKPLPSVGTSDGDVNWVG